MLPKNYLTFINKTLLLSVSICLLSCFAVERSQFTLYKFTFQNTKKLKLHGYYVHYSSYNYGKIIDKDLYFFYKNGFFAKINTYDDKYKDSVIIEEYLTKKRVLYDDRYAWGCYQINGNKIIMQLMMPTVTGGVFFPSIIKPLERECKILNDSTIIFNTNFYELPERKIKYLSDTCKFVQYISKPDSTNWIIDSKWYKKYWKNKKI